MAHTVPYAKITTRGNDVRVPVNCTHLHHFLGKTSPDGPCI
ncbi:similar to hypothetical protein (predicted), isoform CRA_b [Rattus norvegicus]|uniref:Uncharacterized protein RGD1565432_predicted n=1 Tax=Rattus norvegicus TaxID=10116 RepID=A6JBH8_RAT|nr:similar to hypothetical protein (predicted), isoform CRA_b [Rattus norvegicus]